LLFGTATDAVKEIRVHPRASGQRSALVSIVFSVIALKSFVSEMMKYAQIMSPTPPEAVTFAQIMGDAEEDSGLAVEAQFGACSARGLERKLCRELELSRVERRPRRTEKRVWCRRATRRTGAELRAALGRKRGCVFILARN